MKRALVVVALASILAVLAFATTREITLDSPLVGGPAPAFDEPLFDADSTLALGDLRGRPVVLNFWASWCFSCRAEAAVLEAGWQRYGPEVAFVGLAVNDEAAPARAFIDRYRKTYLLAADADGSVAIDYGLYGVPETFFIDPSGRIVSKHIGPLTGTDLDRAVAALETGDAGAVTGDPASTEPIGGER